MANTQTKNRKPRVPKAKSIRQAEFVKNPARSMKQAAHGGSLVLTDTRGKPRLLICIPSDKRPFVPA